MIETARLVLRPWVEADRNPFWVMSQDSEVMRYLPAMTRRENDDAIDRMMAMQNEHGHCFWAVESKAEVRFLGFCGILPPREPTFEFEIGWRLERASWGKGLALEAARASLDWAWNNIRPSTVVAITVPANLRSRNLMERLGMTRFPDEDFDHPALAETDLLRRHVLYRIAKPN